MESNISNALMLLFIGMSTVFVILMIVVVGGKILIHLVNKVKIEVDEVPFTKITIKEISTTKEAVIQAAVKILTNGKGRVQKIERK